MPDVISENIPDPSQDSSSPQSPEDSGCKPPVAERRIQANRRNALRSTGPTSERGKYIASRNSLKQGLLAKSAVITLGPAKENKAEFEELLSGLRDYFCPVGAAEELLVEEIAVSYWMERRAQLHENGEIHKQAHVAVIDDLWEEVQDDGAIGDLLEDPFKHRRKILMSSKGLVYVLSILSQIREEVEVSGQASAELLGQLSQITGRDWNVSEKSEMLNRLDREKKRLERVKKKLGRLEAADRSAKIQNVLLLAPEKLEGLLRYNVANERRRYRALAQLERLQRQRKGEAVPPPIEVQVTGDRGDFAKRSQ
jgi:hypothetical protein